MTTAGMTEGHNRCQCKLSTHVSASAQVVARSVIAELVAENAKLLLGDINVCLPFFLKSGFPFLTEHMTMSPAAAAGSLFSLAPHPTVEIRYKFLAPELSAQLITAPTGRANDIRNLFPDAPPRPLFEAMVFLFASHSAHSASLSVNETAQTIHSLHVLQSGVVLPVYSPKELLLLGGLYKSETSQP